MATISLTSTAAAVVTTASTLADRKTWSLTSTAATVVATSVDPASPHVQNILGEIGAQSVPYFGH